MPYDEKPSPEELERRALWFGGYGRQLEEGSTVSPPVPGRHFACPCCLFLTLSERGGFDICKVCFWEDDGQDDRDAAAVRGGPNGTLSLEQARKNYAAFGACEERFKKNVRPPLREECGDAG